MRIFMDNSQSGKQQQPKTLQQPPKETHVKGYDEFVALQKSKKVPPAENHKVYCRNIQKTTPCTTWWVWNGSGAWMVKNYGVQEENKGFALYDNDEQALLHEDAGDRIWWNG